MQSLVDVCGLSDHSHVHIRRTQCDGYRGVEHWFIGSLGNWFIGQGCTVEKRVESGTGVPQSKAASQHDGNIHSEHRTSNIERRKSNGRFGRRWKLLSTSY
jgi:hypothetical protein